MFLIFLSDIVCNKNIQLYFRIYEKIKELDSRVNICLNSLLDLYIELCLQLIFLEGIDVKKGEFLSKELSSAFVGGERKIFMLDEYEN